MNRKLICAVLASGAALFASSAMAADLPSSAPAPAPYIAPPPPVFTWTGFYVGVNAGIAFNGNTSATLTGPGGTLTPSLGGGSGFTGGGEIGYNMQVNQIVFGLEGDVDYLYQRNLDGAYTGYTLSGGNPNEVFGTLRGRLGYAVDRALFYVTGGMAFAGNKGPTTINVGGTTYTGSGDGNTVGAVVGGGIEYAFTPHWSGKVEYLHTFFGKNSLTYTSAGGNYTTSGYDFDNNIVRVGLNYKF